MILHTFSTLGCPELDLEGVIALAARHGFHALELRTLSNSNNLPELFARKFGDPDRFAQYMHARRQKVVALSTSFNLVGNSEGDREELVAHVPWADAGDVTWLRVFDGGSTGDAAEIAEMKHTLTWWKEQRIKNGWAVDLMIETRDTLVTNERLKDFLATVPSANILWDTHHTWKKGGEDPVKTWDLLRKNTVHVHVKDSISKPSTHHPYTYVLPGDGEFPMPVLRKALEDGKYKGAICLEMERFWHPYLPPLDKALHVAHMRGWW